MKWIYQYTLKQPFSIEGKGVHSNKRCRLRCYPAPSNFGIQFLIRSKGNQTFLNSADYLTPIVADLRSVLRDYLQISLAHTKENTLLSKDIYVDTVEHLLASFYVFNIRNCLIELTSPEIPILDGSASVFIDAILHAGIQRQDERILVYPIPSQLVEVKGVSQVEVIPANSFSIESTVYHPNKMPNRHYYASISSNFVNGCTLDLFAMQFINEIASARTYGFLSDWEQLKKYGFARGSNSDNTLIFHDRTILNSPSRYLNECARHKIIDFLGALSLLPFKVQAHFRLRNSNHHLDIRLMKKIYALLVE